MKGDLLSLGECVSYEEINKRTSFEAPLLTDLRVKDGRRKGSAAVSESVGVTSDGRLFETHNQQDTQVCHSCSVLDALNSERCSRNHH